jgi:hypothetical protein
MLTFMLLRSLISEKSAPNVTNGSDVQFFRGLILEKLDNYHYNKLSLYNK